MWNSTANTILKRTLSSNRTNVELCETVYLHVNAALQKKYWKRTSLHNITRCRTIGMWRNADGTQHFNCCYALTWSRCPYKADESYTQEEKIQNTITSADPQRENIITFEDEPIRSWVHFSRMSVYYIHTLIYSIYLITISSGNEY